MVSFLEKDNKFNSVSKREKPLFYKKNLLQVFSFFYMTTYNKKPVRKHRPLL